MILIDYDELSGQLQKAGERLVSNAVIGAFAGGIPGIRNLSVSFSENGATVKYEVDILGIPHEDSCYIEYRDDLEDKVAAVIKRIAYIKQLREQYKEYCALNDHIQKYRKRSKSIKTGEYYNDTCSIDYTLCGLLKLPNTTNCGIGGGDYEIKRTPKRVKEFRERAQKTIDFLNGEVRRIEKALGELREIEQRFAQNIARQGGEG
jgi:hypothetical protein